MAVECTCEQCGKIFTLAPSQVKQRSGARYCSRGCYFSTIRNQVDCVCQQCGNIFTAKPSRIEYGGGKYCSLRCSNDAKYVQIECTCEECGKPFMRSPSLIKQGGGKYCSHQCRGIGTGRTQRGQNNVRWRGGHGDYRGENWYQQRKLAYDRDQGICQHCGKKPRKGQRRNAVHHIRPYREFKGDYIAANQLTNLITLCPQCHPDAEFGKIAVQPYLF